MRQPFETPSLFRDWSFLQEIGDNLLTLVLEMVSELASRDSEPFGKEIGENPAKWVCELVTQAASHVGEQNEPAVPINADKQKLVEQAARQLLKSDQNIHAKLRMKVLQQVLKWLVEKDRRRLGTPQPSHPGNRGTHTNSETSQEPRSRATSAAADVDLLRLLPESWSRLLTEIGFERLQDGSLHDRIDGFVKIWAVQRRFRFDDDLKGNQKDALKKKQKKAGASGEELKKAVQAGVLWEIFQLIVRNAHSWLAKRDQNDWSGFVFKLHLKRTVFDVCNEHLLGLTPRRSRGAGDGTPDDQAGVESREGDDDEGGESSSRRRGTWSLRSDDIASSEPDSRVQSFKTTLEKVVPVLQDSAGDAERRNQAAEYLASLAKVALGELTVPANVLGVELREAWTSIVRDVAVGMRDVVADLTLPPRGCTICVDFLLKCQVTDLSIDAWFLDAIDRLRDDLNVIRRGRENGPKRKALIQRLVQIAKVAIGAQLAVVSVSAPSLPRTLFYAIIAVLTAVETDSETPKWTRDDAIQSLSELRRDADEHGRAEWCNPVV